MIFYGTKATKLKNGEIRNVTCPHCETEASMKFGVYQKYAHGYLIPFFPVSKIIVAECNHCKKTFGFKELTPQIQDRIAKENERLPVKTPIWTFSGLFIVAALIGLAFYMTGETNKKEAIYIKNPKVGDVYFIECDTVPSQYSTLRVDKVTKDSIECTANEYVIDNRTHVDEIDVDTSYTTAKYAISRKEIEHLHAVDTIFTIKRN